MATQAGQYVIGQVLGYKEEPWKNESSGRSGMNRQLAVVTNEYVDQWQEKKKTVQIVDVPQDIATSVAVEAEKLKGKTVMVRVVFRANKGGRDGAWLSCFMPKDSVIQTLKQD